MNITTVRVLMVIVLSSLIGASSTMIAAPLPTDTKENVLNWCRGACLKLLVPDTNEKILTLPVRPDCGHECGSQKNVQKFCNYARGETYKAKCETAASKVNS